VIWATAVLYICIALIGPSIYGDYGRFWNQVTEHGSEIGRAVLIIGIILAWQLGEDGRKNQ
jgi:hypothetical protein